MPEGGYQGEYLSEMADRMRAELGDAVTEEQAREWGYLDVVAHLQDDLGRIGVHFDTWFSERTLHERGDVKRVLSALAERSATFENDGATWLRTSDFGDQRDRVSVKSDGSTTYLCNDLAYHEDKFSRGWTHLIDIWGADHHGQVKSLQSGLEALGHPAGEPEVLLGQLVKLLRSGVPVRISKRAGNVVTLADILDEVDPDVCRLTFLLQSIDTTQTFDLDVVTAQSMENPVYYVQYAHARIASIGRQAARRGIQRLPVLDVDLAPLVHERELDVLRALAVFPEVVEEAAAMRAPHRVATWVRDFASRFHGFYRDCRVISDDVALTQARLWLAEASRIGLSQALAILGVGAPDEMHRLDDDDDETTCGMSAGPFDQSLISSGLRDLDLDAVAEEFGTPVFVYDEDALRRNCEAYMAEFGAGNVAYAGKAFLCTAMVKLVDEAGLHLDVATGGELHVALNAGFPADRIVFHGNNKSSEELRVALDRGCWPNRRGLQRRDRPPRGSRRADRCRASCPRAGHPGRRGTHA